MSNSTAIAALTAELRTYQDRLRIVEDVIEKDGANDDRLAVRAVNAAKIYELENAIVSLATAETGQNRVIWVCHREDCTNAITIAKHHLTIKEASDIIEAKGWGSGYCELHRKEVVQ